MSQTRIIVPRVKYYKTKFEGQNEDRYEMFAEMLAEDCVKMVPRHPRILHVKERNFHGYNYLTAIVVWEGK